MSRGVSEYLVCAVRGRRIRRSRCPICSATPARSRSAAWSPSSAPRAGWARRRSRTISPGDLATALDRRPSSPTSTSPSAPPASISTRTRRRASRKRSSRPSASIPTFVDRLLSKCGDKLSLLAAPATLDTLYDFSETSFDPLIDTLRASTPFVVLDVPHAWTAWTRTDAGRRRRGRRRRRARPRQPSQRQEHRRCPQDRAAARPSAAAGAQWRRHAETPRNRDRGIHQDDRASSRSP